MEQQVKIEVQIDDDQMVVQQQTKQCDNNHYYKQFVKSINGLDMNIKISKNVPNKHLKPNKTYKNNNQAIYMDMHTKRIIKYPRKNSFEVFYKQILVYSKIRLKYNPDLIILSRILKCLIQICGDQYKLDKLMRYRHLEKQFRFISKENLCIYEDVMSKCYKDCSINNIRIAIDSLCSKNINLGFISKSRTFIPYNRYTSRQKAYKLHNIYTQSTKYDKKHNNDKQSNKLPYNQKLEKHKDLFDMVRMDCMKKTDRLSNLVENMQLGNLTQIDKNRKDNKIYLSFTQTLKNRNNMKRKIKKCVISKKNDKKQQRKIQIQCLKLQQLVRPVNDDCRQKQCSISLGQLMTVKQLQWQLPKKQLSNNSQIDKLSNQMQQSEKVDKFQSPITQTYKLSQNYIKILVLECIDQINYKIISDYGYNLAIKTPTQNINHKQITQAKQWQLTQQQLQAKLEQQTKLQQQRYKSWNQYNKQAFVRQQAPVTSKFCQKQNFNIDLVQAIFDGTPHEIDVKQHLYFQITGEQLTQNITMKSLKSMYSPEDIKLFPNIFKQVENYSTNLAQLVNMMLRSNPITISRIFQNKKSIHPHGIYCVWLKNPCAGIQPIFVDDYFAVYQKKPIKQSDLCWSDKDLVYAKISSQNSIWFMILEKAIAKLLGGYHTLMNTNLSVLMQILMGYPTVDFSNLSIDNAISVFDQQKFVNKIATFYTKNYVFGDDRTKCIDRIVGFTLNEHKPRQSRITLRSGESTNQLYLYQFLLQYGQTTLSFFSSNFFINQTTFSLSNDNNHINYPRKQFLSCKIKSTMKNNVCLFAFNFGKIWMKYPCKVILYRLKCEVQTKFTEGMNPLSQQRGYFDYIGQLKRYGDFFFENQLDVGQYICILQLSLELNQLPTFMLFSQKQVSIYHKQVTVQPNQPQDTHQNKLSIHNKQNIYYKSPKILIQQPVRLNTYKKSSFHKNKKISPYKTKKIFLFESSPSDAEQNEIDFLQ